MKTQKLENVFNRILKSYNLNETQVIFASSVMDWSNKSGIKENNPDRLAISAHRNNSDIWDIIIKEEITESNIAPVTSAMWYRGFKHYNELKELKKFITHTFLHEVAHIIGKKAELEADNWAWSELPKFFQ